MPAYNILGSIWCCKASFRYIESLEILNPDPKEHPSSLVAITISILSWVKEKKYWVYMHAENDHNYPILEIIKLKFKEILSNSPKIT